jgi:hypothetical protein
MIFVLIAVFVLDVAACVLMGRKFLQFFTVKRGKMCEYVAVLNFYLGATAGVLLWSYIIGLIISISLNNFIFLQNIAAIGSAISIIPCILGVLRLIGIAKRQCRAECIKHVKDCYRQSVLNKSNKEK